jgi:hypothetical protein
MALIDSHRVVPSTAAKFCISNKGLRELFVSYQVSKLQKNGALTPMLSIISYPWNHLMATVTVNVASAGKWVAIVPVFLHWPMM